MPDIDQSRAISTRKSRRLIRWLLILSVFSIIVSTVFFRVGFWLDREDTPQRASAIAVLSGRLPDRALEAARLYNEGYAPEVWLTRSGEPGDSLAQISIAYVGEEVYNRQILIGSGVPASAIHILEPPIANTADEMYTIGEALKKAPAPVVMIVTSKVHTRRTHALWEKLSGHAGNAIIRGVRDDAYDAAHWWRSTTDALDVVREVLGLMNVWAGLPLHPAR